MVNAEVDPTRVPGFVGKEPKDLDEECDAPYCKDAHPSGLKRWLVASEVPVLASSFLAPERDKKKRAIQKWQDYDD
jgi:hypothetical protein